MVSQQMLLVRLSKIIKHTKPYKQWFLYFCCFLYLMSYYVLFSVYQALTILPIYRIPIYTLQLCQGITYGLEVFLPKELFSQGVSVLHNYFINVNLQMTLYLLIYMSIFLFALNFFKSRALFLLIFIPFFGQQKAKHTSK